jgi:hypothetical protein
MFSGSDVSKYANPVFGPHLFLVSKGRRSKDLIRSSTKYVPWAALVKRGAVSQFSCKGNSDGGPSFFTQNKTNFYKEIRAGSDNHSHRRDPLSKESPRGQIEASDFAFSTSN